MTDSSVTDVQIVPYEKSMEASDQAMIKIPVKSVRSVLRISVVFFATHIFLILSFNETFVRLSSDSAP